VWVFVRPGANQSQGVDGFVDANSALIDDDVLFRNASVILNPEPGTGLLFGVGLVALAAMPRAHGATTLASRRRRPRDDGVKPCR